jgi:hypothetical protein
MTLICSIILALTSPLFAQGGNAGGGGTGGGNSGGSGNTGGGNSGGYTGGGYTGGGNYTGGSSSGLSSSSSSSSSSPSGSDMVSDFGTTVNVEFQGFTTERQNFIGVDPAAKFVGVDDLSNTSSSSSSRTSSANRSTTRTSTTRRATSGRSMSQGSANIITNGGRAITSTASFDTGDSGLSIEQLRTKNENRQSEIKTKILRLPNLKIDAERFNVSFVDTSTGIVAELTGVVESERASKILKQFLLLEPGIDRVKNELKIESAKK